jgi:hypothetical protein
MIHHFPASPPHNAWRTPPSPPPRYRPFPDLAAGLASPGLPPGFAAETTSTSVSRGSSPGRCDRRSCRRPRRNHRRSDCAGASLRCGLEGSISGGGGSCPEAKNISGTKSRIGGLLGPFGRRLRPFGQRHCRHFLRATANRRHVSTLNSAAAFSIAVAASGASTVPSHVALAATL